LTVLEMKEFASKLVILWGNIIFEELAKFNKENAEKMREHLEA